MKTLYWFVRRIFEYNILTRNPGWDRNAQNLESYNDVRSIQKHLQENDVGFATTVDDQSEGPDSITSLILMEMSY